MKSALAIIDLCIGGLSARVRRAQGDIRQEPRDTSQGHGEPQGVRHSPGNGRGFNSARTRPPDLRAHGPGAGRTGNLYARQDDPQQL